MVKRTTCAFGGWYVDAYTHGRVLTSHRHNCIDSRRPRRRYTRDLLSVTGPSHARLRLAWIRLLLKVFTQNENPYAIGFRFMMRVSFSPSILELNKEEFDYREGRSITLYFFLFGWRGNKPLVHVDCTVVEPTHQSLPKDISSYGSLKYHSLHLSIRIRLFLVYQYWMWKQKFDQTASLTPQTCCRAWLPLPQKVLDAPFFFWQSQK